MMNFLDIFGKIKDMQEAMKKTRERLENVTVDAEAGGGMVRVKANANRKIMKIEVDPMLINKEDPEMMTDLVTAAVNLALEKSDVISKEEISKVTKEYLPNIPGLDPSKFGF